MCQVTESVNSGPRPMRICLLTDQDLDAEEHPDDDWLCDPRPYLPEADWTLAVLEKDTAVPQINELASHGFDLFFNLCDGAWDEGYTPGIEVVQTLERLGAAFTGATSEFYEPSRESMKRACRAWGIDTPAYLITRNDGDLERASNTLRFPLIVKHPSSYSSIDLTRASRVESRQALFERGRRMIAKYAGALVEEFIDGTEATVLVAENPDDPFSPTVYAPVQYVFPTGETFKHTEMKWVDYAQMTCVPVEDPVLAGRLREASARFFVALHGAGYGRCDLRVDEDGRPWMLEINPNCGLYFELKDAGSADLCLMNDPAGHVGFTKQVIAAAFARHARRQRNWEVRPLPDGDYGMFASRDLAAGDIVVSHEATAHHIVSLKQVEQHWTDERRARFGTHAWPLTDDTWVIWGRSPDDWMPIEHSCDPNTWHTGLDLTARRAIRSGEEITIDYAMRYNERMPSFECDCASRICRKTIRGTDYLTDVVDRYGDHVSDYVRITRLNRPGEHRSGVA
ncbi:MAG: SET domain-containing protein-lysine N-methyltransferase [Gemmatimonadales bacterium]|nr:MAG: SET domain-containing protein-lysine N-methyltransferase [Gemmatimonadales bacterium]